MGLNRHRVPARTGHSQKAWNTIHEGAENRAPAAAEEYPSERKGDPSATVSRCSLVMVTIFNRLLWLGDSVIDFMYVLVWSVGLCYHKGNQFVCKGVHE